MKKLAIYTLGLLMAAASTACSSGGGAETLIEATFTTTVARASAISELTDGQQMVVYRNTETSIGKGDPKASALVCQNGVWKGVPALKLDPNETAYFWAAYPYDAEATDPTAYPVSLDKQIDVLYSGNYATATYQKPEAQMTMRHALSIMSFSIESYTGGTLQSIKIGGDQFPLAGTLRVASGKITPTNYGELTIPCNVNLASAQTANMFVIPMGATAADGMQVTFTIDGKEHKCTLPAAAFPANNNTQYVHHLTYTSNGLVLHIDRMEKVDLDEQVVPVTNPDRYAQLKVVHTNVTYMTVPNFTGTSTYGYVYWGNGERSDLVTDVNYVYADAATYTVNIDVWNADVVDFRSMAGVQEVDFSKF